jgi:hypothetical protein
MHKCFQYARKPVKNAPWDQCYDSPSVFFAELQKATGLRVLRKILDRQHCIERDEEHLLRQLRQSGPSSAASANGEAQFSRKPPARLKPLNVDNDD